MCYVYNSVLTWKFLTKSKGEVGTLDMPSLLNVGVSIC
jgi:hypothetical protein